MIVGVGTDILKIERIRNSFNDEHQAFLRKTYSVNEQNQAMQRPDPILYYATRFAGKEAVFKALGIECDLIRLSDIELLNNKYGQPQVTLLGNLKHKADEKQIVAIHISLSYDTEYAIAYAIAEGYTSETI